MITIENSLPVTNLALSIHEKIRLNNKGLKSVAETNTLILGGEEGAKKENSIETDLAKESILSYRVHNWVEDIGHAYKMRLTVLNHSTILAGNEYFTSGKHVIKLKELFTDISSIKVGELVTIDAWQVTSHMCDNDSYRAFPFIEIGATFTLKIQPDHFFPGDLTFISSQAGDVSEEF